MFEGQFDLEESRSPISKCQGHQFQNRLKTLYGHQTVQV